MMISSSSTRGGGPPPRRAGRDVIAWAPDELAHRVGGHVRHDAGAGEEPLLPAHLLEEARRVAFEEGYRAGEDAERNRLFLSARALHDGLTSVQDGVDRWIANAEENICALAVAVARHILSRDVAVDRQALLEVVKQAIAEFSIDHPVTVRLHPMDHGIIVPMLVPGDGGGEATRREAEWIADQRVAPGGCVVEGRERIIDGRVDAALERVYRRLTYTGA